MIQQGMDVADISTQVAQLNGGCLADLLSVELSAFGKPELVFVGFLPIGSWLLGLNIRLIKHINEIFRFQSGIVEQVQIGGVGNVLRAGRGINQQAAFVGDFTRSLKRFFCCLRA